MSLIGLTLTAPLLLLIGLMIWLSEGRPVLFRQRRVGHGGRVFLLYKFRTMRSVPAGQSNGFDAGNVTRVTRLGKVLRKTKLDELPQLWNVLRGDMSLVGPRPEVEYWVHAYPERWARVLQVRPGITDPAAIVYRHEEEILKSAAEPELLYRESVLPRKLTIYEEYLDKRSFWTDLRILVQTLFALFSRHDSQQIEG